MSETTPLQQLETLLGGDAPPAVKAATITKLAPKLPQAAIAVLEAALDGAEPIVQVAIMDACFEITGDDIHKQALERILEQAASGGDRSEEVYMAARLALGRIGRLGSDALDEFGDSGLAIDAVVVKRRGGPRPKAAARASITIMIHGTWASDGTWWRPSGDFFEYVKKDLFRTDLYGEKDQFEWSGKNRDAQRKKAGRSLGKWLQAHPAKEINVFAHSHGANVAMLATHDEARFDRLVMLSPPVRQDYFARWDKVGSAYNIQADYDPVVAIAKGGQWFELANVREKKMRASGHSASHDPRVWREESLGDFIGIPW